MAEILRRRNPDILTKARLGLMAIALMLLLQGPERLPPVNQAQPPDTAAAARVLVSEEAPRNIPPTLELPSHLTWPNDPALIDQWNIGGPALESLLPHPPERPIVGTDLLYFHQLISYLKENDTLTEEDLNNPAVVVVIDSGMNLGVKDLPHLHPDSCVVIERINEPYSTPITCEREFHDPSFHGTTVISSFSSPTNNGLGIAAEVLPMQVLLLQASDADRVIGGQPQFNISSVLRAFTYLERLIAQDPSLTKNMVVTMSFATHSNISYGMFLDIQAHITRLHELGVIIIAGAGNDSLPLELDDGRVVFPAMLDHVWRIGGTDPDGKRWTAGSAGSNFGEKLDFALPADYVMTAGPSDYTHGYGTSYSAPQAAALAATARILNPELSKQEVYELLKHTTVQEGVEPTHSEETGWGVPNYARLAELMGLGALPAKPEPEHSIFIPSLYR